MTATETLLALSGKATCRVVTDHFILRRAKKPDSIDLDALQQCIRALTDIHWEMCRHE